MVAGSWRRKVARQRRREAAAAELVEGVADFLGVDDDEVLPALLSAPLSYYDKLTLFGALRTAEGMLAAGAFDGAALAQHAERLAAVRYALANRETHWHGQLSAVLRRGVAAAAAAESIGGDGRVCFDAVQQLVAEGLVCRSKGRFCVLPAGRWPALEVQLFAPGPGAGGDEFDGGDGFDGVDGFGGEGGAFADAFGAGAGGSGGGGFGAYGDAGGSGDDFGADFEARGLQAAAERAAAAAAAAAEARHAGDAIAAVLMDSDDEDDGDEGGTAPADAYAAIAADHERWLAQQERHAQRRGRPAAALPAPAAAAAPAGAAEEGAEGRRRCRHCGACDGAAEAGPGAEAEAEAAAEAAAPPAAAAAEAPAPPAPAGDAAAPISKADPMPADWQPEFAAPLPPMQPPPPRQLTRHELASEAVVARLSLEEWLTAECGVEPGRAPIHTWCAAIHNAPASRLSAYEKIVCMRAWKTLSLHVHFRGAVGRATTARDRENELAVIDDHLAWVQAAASDRRLNRACMVVLRALALAGGAWLASDRLLAEICGEDMLGDGGVDAHALLGLAVSRLVRERFVVAMAPHSAPDRRGALVSLVPSGLVALRRTDPAIDAAVRDRLAGY
ncbi:hypothetical protein Rsub_02146 [Raphidocelis subcapitata]|uniref:Uncharacterized protein n=1 Tax=Raphidocelis subcapitata TaxID=307507 RepID=A0A2V0NPR4_9CHLO|nr:hypothetical protein Rsub_02146 [Raphidocelis subcapitata]|eukprot:GBF89269.1 hypothetical protein Rsub_02146 [Raphidocelis subcapitata]